MNSSTALGNGTDPGGGGGGLAAGITDLGLNFPGSQYVEIALVLIAICIGLVFLFYGTKLFKVTLYIFAFLVGAGVGYLIFMLIHKDSRAALITGGVLGCVVTALVRKVWRSSLFLLGAGVGFTLWLTFKNLFPDVLKDDLELYSALVITCMVLGAVALKLEQLWLLFGTPLIGAFLTVSGLDYFVPGDYSVLQLIQTSKGCVSQVCYILYGMLFFLAAAGFFIQYKYTSEYAEEQQAKKDRKAARLASKERRRRRKKDIQLQDFDDDL
jgi:hypothetical protein